MRYIFKSRLFNDVIHDIPSRVSKGKYTNTQM